MTMLAGRMRWMGRVRRGREQTATTSAVPAIAPVPGVEIDIAPNDPLLPYLASVGTAVDIGALQLESPAVEALRAANVKLVVPLVSQGELIGLLNLGPRLSEQEFSSDDRRLLNNLAAQAAPAVRVAQLVRQQEIEAGERERIAQELRLAQLIQQQFLPKQLPDLSGWHLAAYYQPAREVGGDFYDFIPLPTGELGIVVGDVTDKGVPAALVMASTRSLLRTEAARLDSPGAVLARVNDLLCPDIPERMFVTCLYAILDENSGRLRYANAGHNLPYHRHGEAGVELRATGLPLGLLPGMNYEEKEAFLGSGDELLLYSDGLVEAHNAEGEMYGFPRLLASFDRSHPDRETIDTIDTVLNGFTAFVGTGREQEDDITLVAVRRSAITEILPAENQGRSECLVAFSLPSAPGNEREAMERVTGAVASLGLDKARLDQLGTAVAEATMNAIEHGNQNREDVPVDIAVTREGDSVVVRIRDHGNHVMVGEVAAPDIDLKLAGLQSPRGWGLFLIQNMVDDLRHREDPQGHTIELVMHLGERSDL